MIGRVVCCALLAPGILAAQAPTGVALTSSQASGGATAQSAAVDSGAKVTLGAFIDGYYAWDEDRPSNSVRGQRRP